MGRKAPGDLYRGALSGRVGIQAPVCIRHTDSTVPSVSTAHTACPTLEQVLRRVPESVWKRKHPGAAGGMKLEIPKANLPLYPVLEDTLESQAAGMSGPHSQRDLGERAECGTGPSPLRSAQPPCPLSGNCGGSWAAHQSFLSSSHKDSRHGGTEARALDF